MCVGGVVKRKLKSARNYRELVEEQGFVVCHELLRGGGIKSIITFSLILRASLVIPALDFLN